VQSGHFSTVEHLFVYGTLRRAAEHSAISEVHEAMRAYSVYIGEGTMQATLFQVEHFPGAIVSTSPEHRVVGELYAINEVEMLFSILDTYEGCFDTPPLFWRTQVPVTQLDGSVIAAWVYLYNRSVEGLQEIPSGDFLRQ
jgi:gamma-glutamylcyclotransferase (GGCT)/AIG2-like uncharacterized protein YtfP